MMERLEVSAATTTPGADSAERVGLRAPADWPGPGPVDLHRHDLPHESSSIEWWYVNAHLEAAGGDALSLFASFFQVTNEENGERKKRHFLVWGIANAADGTFISETLIDRRGPEDGVRQIDRGKGGQDPRLRRALREVFAKGSVPAPDCLLAAEGRVAKDRLALDFDGNTFEKLPDGRYRLALAARDGRASAHLTFTPEKPVVRHGDDGVVCGDTDEAMFYYFIPRCRVEGSLTLAAQAEKAVTGSGWYDHEFGRSTPAADDEVGPSLSGHGWNWISAQLDDGSEFSAFVVVNRDEDDRVVERRAVAIDPQGVSRTVSEVSFDGLEPWTSCRTFNDYPVRWRVVAPGLDLQLDVAAEFPEQEVVTLMAPPSFWEGRVRVSGTRNGRPVSGLGFVERTGFCDIQTLDDFFSAVGRETRQAIDRLVPLRPSGDEVSRLLGGIREGSLDGVDRDQFRRTVLEPIHHVVGNGGKAWRSYGFLACLDAVGTDPNAYRGWLAMPELIHVGSLIVDDVEDQSEIRRGGPACHKVFGEALAINAGTACYFLAELVLANSDLDDRKRARAYGFYFEAMRAAHAGQALDIDGQRALMALAVESGDRTILERRVLAAHRLKAAISPAALARLAALIGEAGPEAADALTALFDAYGVAFQIVDDVLNLRGFEGELKPRGEDIRQGKVTAPIARAVSLLDLNGRRRLWQILESKPTDGRLVDEAIALVESCGALEACDREARELIEAAWKLAEGALPDSYAKVRLRAFGWFILDRHY